MTSTVITVARTLGAGGEELGEAIADALGFRYVDAEIIDRAAALAGVEPGEVAKAEDRPGLVKRILAGLPGAGAKRTHAHGSTDLAASGFEGLITEVIRETAAMEFVVIVAHGAAVPLAGTPGLLRVLVTAPAEVRALRLVGEDALTLEEASRRIEESDAARADFLKRFYGLERELPTHYDLIINTGELELDEGLAAVLAVARG